MRLEWSSIWDRQSSLVAELKGTLALVMEELEG